MKNKQGISFGSHSSSELYMDQNIEGEAISPTNLTQDVAMRDVFKLENIVDILNIKKGDLKKEKTAPQSAAIKGKDNLKPRRSILVINNQHKSNK